MGLTGMAATFGNVLWFYFLPIYYEGKFGLSSIEIGYIYALWLVLTAIGVAPAGALADTFGRKKIIVLSSLISAASAFLFAIAKQIWVAICLRTSGGWTGLFSSFEHPCCGIYRKAKKRNRFWFVYDVHTDTRGFLSCDRGLYTCEFGFELFSTFLLRRSSVPCSCSCKILLHQGNTSSRKERAARGQKALKLLC